MDRRTALEEFRRDPVELLTRIAAECKDIGSLDLGRFKVFLVNHPEYVKDVLVTNQDRFEKGAVFQEPKRLLGEGLLTSEGELHRRQRRLIRPVFRHPRMSSFGDLIVRRADEMGRRWRIGETVDVSDEMVQLTMSILAKVVLDADVDSDEARRTARALAAGFVLFGRLASPVGNLLAQVPSPLDREYEALIRSLEDTTARLIRERRARGTQGEDVLSRLLAARDESGEPVADRQVRDEVLTALIAGHETWSNSLSWAWYLLSANPGPRLRLEEEVDEVLGGRPPTVEDLPRLRYTELVWTESLRLYPPVWAIPRTAITDHEIDGYSIPQGSIVLVSPYVVHRDERWFPEPLEFRPERWASDETGHMPTFAYFPFGGGTRVCVGQPLARLAGLLIIPTIVRRWRLELVPGHAVRAAAPLLRPVEGMPMTVEAR